MECIYKSVNAIFRLTKAKNMSHHYKYNRQSLESVNILYTRHYILSFKWFFYFLQNCIYRNSFQLVYSAQHSVLPEVMLVKCLLNG